MYVNRNLHNVVITYYLIIKIPTNQCTGRIYINYKILDRVFFLLYIILCPISPQVYSHGTPACMYIGADKGQHAWPKHPSFISLYPVLFGGCRESVGGAITIALSSG